MKKKKKKKKLKLGRLIFLLLILSVISFMCVKYINIPITSILIEGNEILTDQDIIEMSDLDNYPSYLKVMSFSIENKLNKSPYIKSVKVTKGLLNIKINIKENKVLYIDKETNYKVTIKGKIKDDKVVCAPYLTNTILEDKKEEFIKALNKINKNILCKMSEIKYDPNDIDLDRYFVYMNDGNRVYLTVNKFNKINKYNEILENIGKQNGILYLDYGDYFEAGE